MESYGEYYHTVDPWLEGVHRCGFRAGNALVGDQLVERRAFLRTEYYSDFLKPYDIGEICTTGIDLGLEDNAPVTGLSIYREIGATPFDQRAAQRLASLAPHIRRALRLHWHISSLEHRNATNTEVLDRLNVGVVLVSSSAHVTYLNAVAQTLTAASDGLSIVNGELEPASAAEAAKLRNSVLRLTSSSTLLSPSAPDVFQVSRPSGRRPYRLTIIPLPAREHFLVDRRAAAAIVFVTDEAGVLMDSVAELGAAYHLTDAERRLVQVLLDGQSLKQASRRLGISVNTAHTQIQSVFLKTDVHRQADLVRLAMSMANAPRA